ncbi:MAG: hypothetical protein ABI888_06105 [Chloroflexota bacterium]
MAESDTPRVSDDAQTAEGKSRTVDERIPDHEATADVPAEALTGAFAANVPQSGNGAPTSADLGPGEEALEQERKAQRTPTRHG